MSEIYEKPKCELCNNEGNGMKIYNKFLCGNLDCLHAAQKEFKLNQLKENKDYFKELINEVLNER